MIAVDSEEIPTFIYTAAHWPVSNTVRKAVQDSTYTALLYAIYDTAQLTIHHTIYEGVFQPDVGED